MVTVKIAAFETRITNIDKASVGLGESIVITGNFAVTDNKVVLKNNSNQSTDLVITAQSTTSITAKIPTTLAEGSYTLLVTSNNVTAEYTTKITTVDPSKPRIISLDKDKYTQGIGKIIVTGVNLKPAMGNPTIYFKMVNGASYYSSFNFPLVNEEGTEVSFTNFGELKIGKQVLYAEIDGVKTNEIEFEIVENTTPAPIISSVDNTNPTSEDIITITGQNFSDKENTHISLYKYISYWDSYEEEMLSPSIISITPTTITFKLGSYGTGEKFKIKIKANGKTSSYSSVIIMK